MEDLEEVRQRMKNKKQQQPVLTRRSFEKFYHFAIGTMTLCLVLLIGSCFIKVHPEIDVMAFIDQHILTILPSFDFQKEQEVSQNVVYEQVSDHVFMGSDENIYAMDSGIVQEVNEDTIIVLYQNGITATYSGFVSSNVKAYDRIVSNEILGTYEQNFTMHLEKNGQSITYEELYS